MAANEYEELGQLSDEAFDRSLPATVQKAKLLRYKELAAKLGESQGVTFYWGDDPTAAKTIDIVQDELDHVEWRIENGR